MPKSIKIIFVFIISLFGLSFLFFNIGLNFLAKKVNKPTEYLKNSIQQVVQENSYHQKDKINFILLGLDERHDSLETTETTDTIIFISLNLKTAKTTLISIPRDLWFYDLNSKINQIYPQSLAQSDKYSYIKTNFSKLIGQNIDHVIVLNTNNLIKFVKLSGGIDVYLENGFIDKQYPNPDYIKDPKSGVPIYQTVEFKSGDIHLDESNITEFVRSRKGGDTLSQGGTDLARIQRQQLVIDALIKKFKDGKLITSFNQACELYKFWDQELSRDISDVQIAQIAISLIPQLPNFSLDKKEITIGNTAKDGLIYHPNSFINKQWVFIPADKDYKSFQQFFSDSI